MSGARLAPLIRPSSSVLMPGLSLGLVVDPIPASWMSRCRCHACGATEPLVVMMPRMAHRRHDIPERDVGADSPMLLCLEEQCADQAAQLVGVGGIRAADKLVAEAAVLTEGSAQRPEKPLHPVAVAPGEREPGGVDVFPVDEPDQFVHQGFLAGEAAIDGADSDSGP